MSIGAVTPLESGMNINIIGYRPTSSTYDTTEKRGPWWYPRLLGHTVFLF